MGVDVARVSELEAERDALRRDVADLRAAASETVTAIEALAGMEVGSMHPNDFAVRGLKVVLARTAPTQEAATDG